MNIISEEFLKTIISTFRYGGGDDEQCAENCYYVFQKHCLGLIDFIQKNNFVLYKDDLWYQKGKYTPLTKTVFYTQEQLLNIYIENTNIQTIKAS